MHEEGDCDLFPFYFYVEPWGRRLKPILGENLDLLVVIRDGHMRECVIQSQYERVGRKVFESLPAAFPRYMEMTDFWLERLAGLCGELESRSDWKNASNGELDAAFSGYCETMQRLNTFGMMITLMEYAKSSFVSDKLHSLLSEHLQSIGSDGIATQVLSDLATPFQPTFMRHERVEAARIALASKRGKDVSGEIASLWQSFKWLSYGYAGPVLPKEHFELEVKNLSELSERELKEFEGEELRTLDKHARMAMELRLSPEILSWLCMGRQFMFKKEYRKQLSYRAFAAVEGLQKEIARRSGLSLKQLRYFTPEEVSRLLAGEDLAGLANERMKFVAYLIEGEKVSVMVGAEAEAVERQIAAEEIDPTLKELRGQCAYPGRAPVVGRARIIMKAEESGRLEKGDILVSHSTNPNMVMAMKRAGAIVTDQGGITCHAAIVSRELKVPCVTGVKIASLLFKDGDLLEVDAAKGIVRKV